MITWIRYSTLMPLLSTCVLVMQWNSPSEKYFHFAAARNCSMDLQEVMLNLFSHSLFSEIISKILYVPELKSFHLKFNLRIYVTFMLIEFKLWKEILCLWLKGLCIKQYWICFMFVKHSKFFLMKHTWSFFFFPNH